MLNTNLRKASFVALFLVVVFLLTGCGNSPDKKTQQNSIPQKQEAAATDSVHIGDSKLIANFTEGVLNKGYSLKGNIYYTKSKDFKNVYFFGALVDNAGQLYNCIWASNSINMTDGVISSVNEYAEKVSGILLDDKVSRYDDGYSRINQKLLADWTSIQ